MTETSREHVYVIAEIGVNHNGDVALAKDMVSAAAEAGADAAKFQTFDTDALVARDAAAAPYARGKDGGNDNQYDLLQGLQLSAESFHEIADHCRGLGLDFASTPFDVGSAAFLAREFDLPWLKVPSGEITNGPLIHTVSRIGKPLVISTGMADEAEIAVALKVAGHGLSGQPGAPDPTAPMNEAEREAVAAYVTLLQCTTAYPTPYDQVNLRALSSLAALSGGDVGLSDHTPGVAVSVAAVGLGARMIEKHFTIDRTLPGPDQAASLEPDEFSRLVSEIRQVEQALGSARKSLQPSEADNIGLVRQSIVARDAIGAGEIFSEDNLTSRRPAEGVSPMRLWSLLGRQARRAYGPGELIDAGELE